TSSDITVTGGTGATLAATSLAIAADAVTSAKILDGTIAVGDLGSDAVETIKIKDGNVTAAKVEGLADAEFIIGTDGTAANNSKATMSGDVTMTNAGVTTIGANKVTTTALNVPDNGNLGAILTSEADGSFSWTDPVTMSGDVSVNGSGVVTVDKIKNTDVSGTAPTDGQVLKYNTASSVWEPAAESVTTVEDLLTSTSATNALSANQGKVLDGKITAEVTRAATAEGNKVDKTDAFTGDVTGTYDATVIAADAVTSAKILDGTIAVGDLGSDAVETIKIKDGNVTASKVEGLADAEFIIGTDGTAANNSKATMSGDVTMTNAGVTTIGASKVTNAKLDKSNIP
ncbi:hypothetical protein QUH73_20765, partial [Labilibaculum sp. K2S]|uniref:hypothetical protein n=1 Tax=Labilibaculum sp. K2S TaxID=3056386 RepID=UPI0025A470DE